MDMSFSLSGALQALSITSEGLKAGRTKEALIADAPNDGSFTGPKKFTCATTDDFGNTWITGQRIAKLIDRKAKNCPATTRVQRSLWTRFSSLARQFEAQ
jgi:hypothetical protein